MPLRMGISISNNRAKVNDEKKSQEEKKKLISYIEERIKKISKMNVFEYLRDINGDNEEEVEINSNSTASEEKIDDLKELIRNKELKYKIKI